MTKRALALLLLLLASTARAEDDAEIAKGFENIRNVYAIEQILDARHALGSKPAPLPPLNDPWGTPYRVDVAAYRVVGAGSDRAFDEASWQAGEQFAGLEGDVVFENGRMFRTNRNWLYQRVVAGGRSAQELAALQKAEVRFILFRTPEVRRATGVELTTMAIEELAARIEAHRKSGGKLSTLVSSPEPLGYDAWGTPLGLTIDGDAYRIVSAGADRVFDPASWDQPAVQDPAADIVFAGGRVTRKPDPRAFVKSVTAGPLPQPLDPARPADPRWRRIGGEVKAPVVIERVEPVYPEDYRRLRLSGIVIIECLISETGEVVDARVLKSIGPEIDMAGVDAVRKWKFRPATLNGEPIPVIFNLTINFKLE